MNVFLRAIAGVLIALILWISLGKQNKDFSTLLTLLVCVMIFVASVAFLRPLMQFINKIQYLGELDSDLVSVVLKSVGIGILGEISAQICKDAGNESMGKVLQFLSTTVVLWISIPVFERLLTLLDNVLGSL